mgnify:CR=1 FL=1
MLVVDRGLRSWSVTLRRSRKRKSDVVDAEAAARAVLSREADNLPKSGAGEVEMIRHLKIAHDTALKSRTQAVVTLKTLLINAPQALREQFVGITARMTLVRMLAAMRPGAMTSPTASAKAALHALACRWRALHAQIREHDAALKTLVRRRATTLFETPGIGTGAIAEMLVAMGDNPNA